MKALIKTAPGVGNMEVGELPVPEINEHEVLIKVVKAGICGSDLHLYDWNSHVNLNLPVAAGHEFSGVVAAVGSEVRGFAAGDRVVGEPSASVCMTCRYCRSGLYNLCSSRQILGFGRNGCFAEYTKLPAERVHHLPAGVSFTDAAITEPLACCVHAVQDNLETAVDDLVVITGPGTIGQLMLQLMQLSGTRTVMLGTGADTARLALAASFGARTVNIEEADPAECIGSLSGGYGADTVIECSGAPSAARMCLDLVKKRGRYLQMGLFGRPIELDMEKVLFKELHITGSFAQKRSSWESALRLMEGSRIDLSSLVSTTYPLREWKRGFDQFRSRTGFKILLDPVGEGV
jgi:L-iditol 2-dehydrogenase